MCSGLQMMTATGLVAISPNLVDDSPKMVNISTNWAANDPRDPCDLDEEDIGDIGIKRRYRRFVVDT